MPTPWELADYAAKKEQEHFVNLLHERARKARELAEELNRMAHLAGMVPDTYSSFIGVAADVMKEFSDSHAGFNMWQIITAAQDADRRREQANKLADEEKAANA